MNELGCSTLGFRFDPLEVALVEIAEQGFRVIDLVMYPSYCPHFNSLTATDDERMALRRRLDELGLKVATINATDGLLGRPDDRERAMAYARASLRLARELGAYGVTMQSGVEPGPGKWSTVAQTAAADLRELGALAQELGLELTLELHKTMLMATTREALDLMALVDHPSVGVALDPSHLTYAGEDAATAARQLGPHVKHVHLRDGIGENIMVVPGDGTVDFTELARALREIGYKRAVVIELEYERAKSAVVRTDLARAKACIERASAAA